MPLGPWPLGIILTTLQTTGIVGMKVKSVAVEVLKVLMNNLMMYLRAGGSLNKFCEASNCRKLLNAIEIRCSADSLFQLN